MYKQVECTVYMYSLIYRYTDIQHAQAGRVYIVHVQINMQCTLMYYKEIFIYMEKFPMYTVQLIPITLQRIYPIIKKKKCARRDVLYCTLSIIFKPKWCILGRWEIVWLWVNYKSFLIFHPYCWIYRIYKINMIILLILHHLTSLVELGKQFTRYNIRRIRS